MEVLKTTFWRSWSDLILSLKLTYVCNIETKMATGLCPYDSSDWIKDSIILFYPNLKKIYPPNSTYLPNTNPSMSLDLV